MRFSEAIQEFGFDCRARKLSDKTISNYQKQLRYLQRYLEAEYSKGVSSLSHYFFALLHLHCKFKHKKTGHSRI